MALITDFLRDAIWLEGEPNASEAFEKIAADHGRGFAEAYRDQLLAQKHLEATIDAIEGHSGTKYNSHR